MITTPLTEAAEIQRQLRALAGDLQAAAPGAAKRLKAIAADLESPTQSDWSEVDLFRAFNAELLADDYARRVASERHINWIETLRNALVLTPVLITWLGLAVAVDGYYKLLQAHPDLEQTSFLYHWQDGFGGYGFLPQLTLGWIAAIDGALLGLIFLLTLLAFVLVARLNTRRERIALALRDRLHTCLTDAALLFAGANRLAPFAYVSQMERTATAVLEQLASERERLSELSSRKESEVSSLAGFAAAFDRATASMQTTVQTLEGVLGTLHTGLEGLGASVNTLGQQQQGVGDQLRQTGALLNNVASGQQIIAQTALVTAERQAQINAQLHDLTADLRNSLAVLDTVAGGTRSASEELKQALEQLGGMQAQMVQAIAPMPVVMQTLASSVTNVRASADEMSKAATSLSQQQAEIGGKLERATMVLTTAATSQQKTAESMTTISGENTALVRRLDALVTLLTASVQRITDASQVTANTGKTLADTLVAFSGAQTDMLEAIERERTAQANLAGFVNRSTEQLRHVLTTFEDASKSVRAISVDLTRIANLAPRQTVMLDRP